MAIDPYTGLDNGIVDLWSGIAPPDPNQYASTLDLSKTNIYDTPQQTYQPPPQYYQPTPTYSQPTPTYSQPAPAPDPYGGLYGLGGAYNWWTNSINPTMTAPTDTSSYTGDLTQYGAQANFGGFGYPAPDPALNQLGSAYDWWASSINPTMVTPQPSTDYGGLTNLNLWGGTAPTSPVNYSADPYGGYSWDMWGNPQVSDVFSTGTSGILPYGGFNFYTP